MVEHGKHGYHIARYDLGAYNAKPMPPCECGHPWAAHVIPGGIENIDVYPTQRECVDCPCRDYRRSDA